jgi:multiple sugar transport system permease protein
MLTRSKLGFSAKGYAFVLPAFVLIGFIFINPIIRMFLFSLEGWSYLRPQGFNHLRNYLVLLSDPHFYSTMLNNVIIILGVVPVTAVIALAFGQAIFSRIPGYRLYTLLFFIPVVLPDVVIARALTEILNKVGPLNAFISAIGLDFLALDWLGAPGLSLFSIIVSLVWKNIGFALILFLARLTTIDIGIYEAAEIDGATPSQKYFSITLPLLSSTIKIYIVLQVIGLMAFLFNYIHVMTAGGPGYSSTVLEYFIYLNIFRLQEIGRGSAAGVILIALTTVFIYYYVFRASRAERKVERRANG